MTILSNSQIYPRIVGLTVTEAVKAALQSNDEGQLEAINDELAKLQNFTADLVALLHDKGVIGNVDLVQLLGYGWETHE